MFAARMSRQHAATQSLDAGLGDVSTRAGSFVSIAAVAVAGMGLVATYLVMRGEVARPDIALVATGGAQPVLSIQNGSSTVARDVRISLALWDLDARMDLNAGDPGQLLQYIRPIEYVRPGGSVGPWAVDTLDAAMDALPSGHAIFGHAAVQCGECPKRREYWIFYTVGQSGWLHELSEADAGIGAQALTRLLLSGPRYPAVLDELVQPAQRTPIN